MLISKRLRVLCGTLALSALTFGTTACGDDKKAAATATPRCTVAGGKDYVQVGATKAAPACAKTMFAKYQIGNFVKVNNAIIAKAAGADQVAKLGTSFQDKIVSEGATRVKSFTDNLASFLVNVYGNSTDPNFVKNSGPTDMLAVHAGLNITSAQYDYFISDVVVPALTTTGVTTDDLTNCFAPVVVDPAFKASITSCQ